MAMLSSVSPSPHPLNLSSSSPSSPPPLRPSLEHLLRAHLLKRGLRPKPTADPLHSFNRILKTSSPDAALHLFSALLRSDLPPDAFTFPPVVAACAALPSLSLLRSVHAFAFKSALAADPSVASALVTAYASLGLNSLFDQLLDQCPDRDLPLWNAALTALARSGKHAEAASVLARVLVDSLVPNRTTFSGAIAACGRVPAPRLGRAAHGLAAKLGDEVNGDVSVNAALVFMYSKFGDLFSAAQVFRSMPEPNVVAWNSIISAHAQGGEPAASWRLFEEMQVEGLGASNVTLTSVIAASPGLVEGSTIHGFVMKLGLQRDELIGSALVNMYARFGSLGDSRKVFDEVPIRTELGSWNALIMGYSRNGNPREALNLFRRLRSHKELRPNAITMVGALSACAALGDGKKGKALHEYILSKRIIIDRVLETVLIDMYAKCGNVEVARELFEGMKQRDLVAWSVMISGHGIHGQVREAMELFNRMVNFEGVLPDNLTFTAILSACSHAGMVQEGWNYFDMMKTTYQLEPQNEQYACMVDLLGRAGKLDEALNFIKKMPIEPNVSVWGALLGACRIHKNIELGITAAEKLFQLESNDAGYYVLLSNLYAATARWKDASRVRKLMKSKGLQKPQGCSWVQQGGKIHQFCVGDKSHPQAGKIYKKLDELHAKMKDLGYMQDTNLVLHDVNDEVKADMLTSHSERLAIAFALINTSHDEVIRVTKNLRICSDCHNAIKLISQITGRKFVIRDARRFHHLANGECSCGDYW